MEITVRQLDQWIEIVPRLLKTAGQRKIWCFYGDLGAGKTTLVKAITTYLGVQDAVTSPTYSLINEYTIGDTNSKNTIVYHMDLYRLKSIEEALDIGIEDYLDRNTYCFIEWPELIEPLLPSNCIKISIKIVKDSERKVVFL